MSEGRKLDVRELPAAALPLIPDYTLVRCIGRGSYGEVWLARSVTGVWRAIKVVYKHEGEQSKNFDREFKGILNYEPVSRADASLMTVLHVGLNPEEAYFYYVMEWRTRYRVRSHLG